MHLNITCIVANYYENIELRASTAAVYVFKRPGCLYNVQAAVLGESGAKINFEVACKYVRREIRQLSYSDRDSFLEALETVHRIDQATGRRQFGDGFLNYEYFLRKHLARITLEGCTPYHGSDSFLTAHAAFMLEMEQNLQRIDSKIALPFWDFSLDDTLYGHSWFEQSEIFRPGWFGSGDGNGTASLITEGRFAYLPVPSNYSAPEHNGYGRLTEVFNMNPSRYLGRASAFCGLPYNGAVRLPGCAEVRGARESSNLTEFHTHVEYGFHGLLHMYLGGVWDCGNQTLADQLEHGSLDVQILAGISTVMNVLFRAGIGSGDLICPTSCGDDVPFSECRCSCPRIDGHDPTDEEVYQVLESMLFVIYRNPIKLFDLVHYEYNDRTNATELVFKNTTLTETLRYRRVMLDLLCHPGRLSQFSTPVALTAISSLPACAAALGVHRDSAVSL